MLFTIWGFILCTGAYRSSPVASIYVDSGVPPLSLRREELSLRFIAKSLTSKSNPNYKYAKAPLDCASNKPRLTKPLKVRLERDCRNVGILPSQIAEVGYPKSPPWCTPPTRVRLPIGGKKNISNEDMKSEIFKCASEHQGQSVFTDGSKSSEGVGSAVVTGDTVIGRKLLSSCSIFTAEAFAILLAVKHVINKGNFYHFYGFFECFIYLKTIIAFPPHGTRSARMTGPLALSETHPSPFLFGSSSCWSDWQRKSRSST